MVADDADGLPGMARGCVKFAISLLAGIGIVIAGYYFDKHIDDIRNGVFEPWSCSSDLSITGTKALMSKGLTIDIDSSKCPQNLPVHWPLTSDGVKYMRTFRSNDPSWTDLERESFRNSLVKWAKGNKAKVLVGTQISCNPMDDDRDWDEARQMLKALGPVHTLALAIGNELDLLHNKPEYQQCALDLFEGGRLLRVFRQRAAEFRAMTGFEDHYVTSVFSGTVLYEGDPFMDKPGAKVNTFIKNVFESGETRWSFAVNIYPYWSPDAHMDWPGAPTCNNALSVFACFGPNCAGPKTMQLASETIDAFTKKYGYGAKSPFWVGEIGWSAPKCDQAGSEAARWCDDWSSYKTMYKYYKEFLQWDLTASDMSETLAKPPSIVFYFTLRDSVNFGNEEHFGLLNECSNDKCKLNSKILQGQDQNNMLATKKLSFLETLEADDKQGALVAATVLD